MDAFKFKSFRGYFAHEIKKELKTNDHRIISFFHELILIA